MRALAGCDASLGDEPAPMTSSWVAHVCTSERASLKTFIDDARRGLFIPVRELFSSCFNKALPIPSPLPSFLSPSPYVFSCWFFPRVVCCPNPLLGVSRHEESLVARSLALSLSCKESLARSLLLQGVSRKESLARSLLSQGFSHEESLARIPSS